MDIDVAKEGVEVYKLKGIEEAEKVLVKYYTEKDGLEKIQNVLKIKYAREWIDLIDEALQYHYNEEYMASIPLLLLIIDGVISKTSQNYGFFSSGVDLEVKESLLFNQIQTVKDICFSTRKKINVEKIYIPYRNGILHGKDINFANGYVSSKLINLLTGILDWLNDKEKEEKRLDELKKREILESKSIEENLIDIIIFNKKSKADKEYLNNWTPENILFIDDKSKNKNDNVIILPGSGELEDYNEYPYIQALIAFLLFWKEKNYGCLAKSIKLNSRFKRDFKDNENNPGEVRNLFNSYNLIDFKIIRIK